MWSTRSRTTSAATRQLEHFAAAARVRRTLHARGVYPLFLLAPVAEPHPHHLLLHAEAVGEAGDFLAGGFAVDQEGLLEGDADGCFDRGALLAPAAHDFRGGRGVGEGARAEHAAGRRRRRRGEAGFAIRLSLTRLK